MSEPTILRLHPGEDLRRALERRAVDENTSWFVIGGIGSFRSAVIRCAGAERVETLAGPLELLSLSGTVGPDGAHLHCALSDQEGSVVGGHVCHGCLVETTAELALMQVDSVQLRRQMDGHTGYTELLVTPRINTEGD